VKKQEKTERQRVRFGGSFLFLFWGVSKSQGQTFSKVVIYLPSLVFDKGRLYVALSRARGGDPTIMTMHGGIGTLGERSSYEFVPSIQFAPTLSQIQFAI